MFVNDTSVASNYEFYLAVMQERGWTVVAEEFDYNSAALMFSKEGLSSEVALGEWEDSDGRKTLIVTNQVIRGDN